MFAFEYVRQARGQQVGDAPGQWSVIAIDDAQFGLGQHRPGEALEYLADFHLDVLLWQNVCRDRTAYTGEAVEQRRIDIDADPDGEDAASERVAFFGNLADGAFGCLPDRRQPVSEKQDDRHRPRGQLLAEGLDQCIMDVRPTAHADTRQVLSRQLHSAGILRDRTWGERFDHFVVNDDVEGLAVG